MIVKMYECENCGKRTDDWYTSKDWMHFSEAVNLSISKNQYENSCYKTFYNAGMEDFCSWECFKEFMGKAT